MASSITITVNEETFSKVFVVPKEVAYMSLLIKDITEEQTDEPVEIELAHVTIHGFEQFLKWAEHCRATKDSIMHLMPHRIHTVSDMKRLLSKPQWMCLEGLTNASLSDLIRTANYLNVPSWLDMLSVYLELNINNFVTKDCTSQALL